MQTLKERRQEAIAKAGAEDEGKMAEE